MTGFKHRRILVYFIIFMLLELITSQMIVISTKNPTIKKMEKILQKKLAIRFLSNFNSIHQRFLILNQLKYCPYVDLCGFVIDTLGQSASEHSCCKPCSCDRDKCMETRSCCPDALPQNYLQYTGLDISIYEEIFTSMVINGQSDLEIPTCEPRRLVVDDIQEREISYYMISTCPADTESELRTNCTRTYTPELQEFKYILPVYSERIVYRNKYCALCNNITDKMFKTWKIIPKCYDYKNDNISKQSTLLSLAFSKECYIHYQEPIDLNVKYLSKCGSSISRCNMTGRWKQYDLYLEAACSSYSSEYVYLHQTYQNIFCAMCNGIIPKENSCPKSKLLKPSTTNRNPVLTTLERNFSPEINASRSSMMSFSGLFGHQPTSNKGDEGFSSPNVLRSRSQSTDSSNNDLPSPPTSVSSFPSEAPPSSTRVNRRQPPSDTKGEELGSTRRLCSVNQTFHPITGKCAGLFCYEYTDLKNGQCVNKYENTADVMNYEINLHASCLEKITIQEVFNLTPDLIDLLTSLLKDYINFQDRDSIHNVILLLNSNANYGTKGNESLASQFEHADFIIQMSRSGRQKVTDIADAVQSIYKIPVFLDSIRELTFVVTAKDTSRYLYDVVKPIVKQQSDGFLCPKIDYCFDNSFPDSHNTTVVPVYKTYVGEAHSMYANVLRYTSCAKVNISLGSESPWQETDIGINISGLLIDMNQYYYNGSTNIIVCADSLKKTLLDPNTPETLISLSKHPYHLKKPAFEQNISETFHIQDQETTNSSYNESEFLDSTQVYSNALKNVTIIPILDSLNIKDLARESDHNMSDSVKISADTNESDQDTSHSSQESEQEIDLLDNEVKESDQGITIYFNTEIIVSIICTSLSILSLVIALCTFCYFKEIRKYLPGKNNLALITTLLIAQVIFLIGGLAPFEEFSVPCTVAGILIHFSWLVALFWMNVCTYHMFKTLTRMQVISDDSDSRRICLYFSYTVSMSTIFVALNIAVAYSVSGEVGYGGWTCYITSQRRILLTFGIPVTFVILSNICMFLLVVYRIKNAPPTNRIIKNERNNFVIFAKLSTITGTTWVFGLVYMWTGLPVFSYLFILFNASQGVFIMFAFVINRRVLAMFKQAFKGNESTSSRSSDRQPTKPTQT